MRKFLRAVPVVLLLFLSPACLAQVPAKTDRTSVADPVPQRVERELTRLAKAAGGTVGVSAVHLETGRRVALNPNERFPMASTYKVPIAVQLLTRVDQGEITLDRMVEVKLSDLHPGSGTLMPLLNQPGVVLSVRNLLELMLRVSDNSATDLLLGLAGGPEAVTARMRALDIRDIEVSRPTVNLIADYEGYSLPPEKEWTPELFRKLYGATTPESRAAAARRFETDLRDTSTPEAMAALLEKIYRGGLLKPETGALLIDILERCQTGESRLKGILPPDTMVAHKTGSIGGSANDVGIITLPDDAGHVAIAVFVKSSTRGMAARERAIAQIARTVYDFFLYQPSTPAPVKP